ncbi:MAG: 16S rRNA (guanine(527)-N(7))-methyltransferase RsmG [Gemmatimonadota bacterium]
MTAIPAEPAATVPDPPPAARELFGPAIGAAERYVRLLAGPGVARGLLGPREVPRLWDRHVLNCAAVAELVPPRCTLIDIGSGAGLPGLVLAILLPGVTVTLLERMGRRAAFLRECVAELGLANATVLQAQAGEVVGKLAADVVTARAVAPLSALAPMALPLARPGGLVLAIKGAGAAAEVTAARPVLRRLRVREVTVVSAGDGKVDPAATVVRLVAGP